MSVFKFVFVVLTVTAVVVHAKPSHPFGLQAIPDHFDFAPPVLPPVPFHNEHAHVLPPAPPLYGAPPAPVYHTAPVPFHLPAAPAPVFHAAPSHVLPAPVPELHAAPAHFLPAPLLPAPAHYLPAPVAHFLPAPAPLPVTQVLPPVYEAIPFAASYRAISGPKTTTHHVSVGYVYPSTHHIAKIIAPAPHAHFHAAPLSLSHHHAAPLSLAHHHAAPLSLAHHHATPLSLPHHSLW